jgi:hypothetical protein
MIALAFETIQILFEGKSGSCCHLDRYDVSSDLARGEQFGAGFLRE